MVQIPSWLHSTFKYLSNEYSHAQIRVKMKKLWPRQVEEEKQIVVQKLSHDQEIVLQPENLVATGKLCHDQETWSRPKKNCGDQFAVLRPKMLEKPKKAEN